MPKETKTIKKTTSAKPTSAAKKAVKKTTTKKETPKKTTVTARKTTKKSSKEVVGLTKQQIDNLIKKIKLAEKTSNAETLFKKNKVVENVKKTSDDKNDLVILPDKVNSRLLDKVKLYQDLIHKKAEPAIIKVAIIGGYIFIFSGLFLSLLTVNTINNQTLKANTIASLCEKDKNCFTISGTTSKENFSKDSKNENNELYLTSATKNQEPTLDFLTEPTLPLQEDFKLKTSIKFVKNPILILTSETTGGEIAITPSEEEGDIYTFTLPTSALQNDNFSSIIKATTLADGNDVLFQGTPLLLKTTDTIEGEVGTINENEENEKREEIEEVTEENERDSDTEDEIVTEKEDDENVEKNEIKVENNNSTKNSLKTTFIPETKTLKLSLASETAKKVEIYAQNRHSQTPVFLGLASKVANNWTYFIKENTLPAGEYVVFAEIKNNAKVDRTPFISISINHENLSSKQDYLDENNTDIIILNEKVKKTFSTDGDESELSIRQNYFSNFAEQTEKIGENESNEVINTQINSFLLEKTDSLNREFSRYGSVFLVQNPSLVSLAEKHLQKTTQNLIEDFTKDSFLSPLEISEIAFLIQDKIAFLKSTVEEYETNLQSRSDLIKKDSDNDGISDFDEVNVFNTNPFHPDSDGDSFLDGVEIAQNFNPLNSTPETVFISETPKRVNVQNNYNLKIDQILPLNHINNEVGLAQVFLKINGVAIPNSFVTLVTKGEKITLNNFIKTDNNGNFSFVLEKELENGNYDSYLIYSSNEGGVMERSEVFSFYKVSDLIKNNPTTELVSSENYTSTNDSELTYRNSTASMGVVSLGIILLMMGKVLLREREEEIIEVSLQKNLKGKKK